MCEGCLLSFVSERNSDCEKHNKHLDKDIEKFVEENKKKSRNRNENMKLEKVPSKCSCCGEIIKARTCSSSTRYGRSNSIKSSFMSQSPGASPRPRLWKGEEQSSLDLSATIRSTGGEDNKGIGSGGAAQVIPDCEYLYEDKTPISTSRLLGIPLSESAPISRTTSRLIGLSLSDSPNTTPRFSMTGILPDDKVQLFPDPTITDSDGDHIINRLKSEVKLDRRSLIELYMELDEERNASAIAANNAMAMITRLQEEKAAVQMEALQYQRLMEEQAVYDQQAVQLMKDLLIKREEEIDELEFELENYRDKFGHIVLVDRQVCEVDAEEYQENKSQSMSSSSEKSHPGTPKESSRMEQNHHSPEFGTRDAFNLDFQEERSYLLGLLKSLENNIDSPGEEFPFPSPDREIQQKSSISREISRIRERLRALEAESGFLRHAAMTIRKGSEGTKLLAEVAEHLRKLRQSGSTTPL